MSKPIIDYKEWDVASNKYMPPKINKQQGKAINMISTKTNRSIHVTSPLLHTWGCQDFVGENGVGDGKFSITLNFPNKDYETKDTKIFLEKILEGQIHEY